MSEIKTKSFEFKAINETDKDVTFAFLQGTFTSLDEIKKCYPQVDAIAKDGVVFSKINSADSKNYSLTLEPKGQKTIAHLQKFADKIDMIVERLEMVSDDEKNFAQVIGQTATTPFGTNNLEEIRLKGYKDPNQFETTRLIADGVGLRLTAVSLITFTIAKHSEVDICLDIAQLKRK